MNAIQATTPRQSGETVAFPPSDLNELKRILDMGIEAASDNRELWYVRGVVNKSEGLFAAAARDLEKAVELDSSYAAAWNTLGLVRISLKEFTKAEDALEHAKQLALEEANRFQVEPGEEYLAIIYNLAMFHESLAAYYNRENRIEPSVESRHLLSRHSSEAKKYLEEFLAREQPGSEDYRTARARLDLLP